MIVLLICGIVMAYIIGYLHGWKSGIKIARIWEGFCRDWRMVYEAEIAVTDAERTTIMEVRELRKMYDGV